MCLCGGGGVTCVCFQSDLSYVAVITVLNFNHFHCNCRNWKKQIGGSISALDAVGARVYAAAPRHHRAEPHCHADS